MTTISGYFEQGQLSQAAYAESLEKGWSGGGIQGSPSIYARSLIAKGMCETQAITFANKYKVIDQYTDPESRFSGTVFQDATGRIFMAIRGTEGLSATNDWSTNFGDIGADGIAIDQAISMYNWYQRLITPVGSTVPQYIYRKEITTGTGQGQEIVTPAWLEETSIDVTATGENAGGGLVGASNVAVTGHSLGGHLAMIMSRIAPDLVTSTLTYNSPRVDTNLSTIALTNNRETSCDFYCTNIYDLESTLAQQATNGLAVAFTPPAILLPGYRRHRVHNLLRDKVLPRYPLTCAINTDKIYSQGFQAELALMEAA
jgi:hypothetical protein